MGALIGNLMAGNTQGQLQWSYSPPDNDQLINSFVMGANDTAVAQTGRAWGSFFDRQTFVYAISKSGKLKWARNISDDQPWSDLSVTEDGGFRLIETNYAKPQPLSYRPPAH